jgi:hypothetical protein
MVVDGIDQSPVIDRGACGKYTGVPSGTGERAQIKVLGVKSLPDYVCLSAIEKDPA